MNTIKTRCTVDKLVCPKQLAATWFLPYEFTALRLSGSLYHMQSLFFIIIHRTTRLGWTIATACDFYIVICRFLCTVYITVLICPVDLGLLVTYTSTESTQCWWVALVSRHIVRCLLVSLSITHPSLVSNTRVYFFSIESKYISSIETMFENKTTDLLLNWYNNLFYIIKNSAFDFDRLIITEVQRHRVNHKIDKFIGCYRNRSQ